MLNTAERQQNIKTKIAAHKATCMRKRQLANMNRNKISHRAPWLAGSLGKHPLPLLTSESGSTLLAAVKGWRKAASQATVAATKGQWFIAFMLSLKRPRGSITSIMLSAKDGNASWKIDILAEFEDIATNCEILVCRAKNCKAPIHAEKWDDMLKGQDKIDAAFNQLCIYLNEFNSQMTNATAKAAPVQQAVAEAKYDDDLRNPSGGIAVYVK